MRTLARALRQCAVAALLGCLIGCAGGISSDGGPIGTGIVASVAGNVVAVVDDGSVAQDGASPGVPAVAVSIDEVSGAETTTDAAGNFAIDGEFAGALTLRFRASGVEATQTIDVPAGALVVLADVVVAPGQIDAEAGRQVGFIARVLEVDCAARLLHVEDEHDPPGPFSVLLLDETRLVRRGGAALSCAEIAPGQRVAIDSLFEPAAGPGAVVTALAVTVGAERGERPDVVEDVPFLGFVAAVRCDAGILTVADSSQRTRLRLTARTVLARGDGSALACAAIAVGDRVSGLGRLRVRQPGVIEATSVVVTTGQGAVDVRISGAVVGRDCTAGVLQLEDGDGVVAVVLGPDTVVEPPLTCDEIPLGARVRGLGRVRRGAPDVVLAVRLAVRLPARTRAAGP
jgi:hypothetical protein